LKTIDDVLSEQAAAVEKKKSCSIFVLGPQDSEKEEIIQSEEWLKKGRCPRCGGELERMKNGNLICRHEGLIVTESLREKYGLK